MTPQRVRKDDSKEIKRRVIKKYANQNYNDLPYFSTGHHGFLQLGLKQKVSIPTALLYDLSQTDY